MSFSIGSTNTGMGPRGAIRRFGDQDDQDAFDRRVVARLLVFLVPHWGRMALAFVLMLIESALTLAVPFLLKVAIDQHIAQGDICAN